jgi:RNA polymerase sigma-70 factor (ECF subfamily)
VRRAGADEAEDLVQEVFLCLQSRAVAEDIEDVERYLFKVAHNVLTTRARSRAVRGEHGQVSLDLATDPVDDLSPERVLLAKQEYARAIVAMRRLPPRAQAAFLLHRFRRMTYPMIARRMGISLSAVKQLIARALAQIAEDMERAP